jgi:hypothetical protein
MKANAVKYGLISRDDMQKIIYKPKAYDVACFMLGRRINRWIVLKITADAAMVVNFTTAECFGIQKELENA